MKHVTSHYYKKYTNIVILFVLINMQPPKNSDECRYQHYICRKLSRHVYSNIVNIVLKYIPTEIDKKVQDSYTWRLPIRFRSRLHNLISMFKSRPYHGLRCYTMKKSFVLYLSNVRGHVVRYKERIVWRRPIDVYVQHVTKKQLRSLQQPNVPSNMGIFWFYDYKMKHFYHTNEWIDLSSMFTLK